MSKEVKRYFVEGPDWELIEDEIGDLVEHEAYKALLEENQRLESAWKVDVLNRKDELIAKQEKENDRVKAERDALLAERDALKAFANEIVSGAFEGGSFDGGDIQDMGVKHGLLRIEQRDDECGESCACREYGFPSECYRKTELLGFAALQGAQP